MDLASLFYSWYVGACVAPGVGAPRALYPLPRAYATASLTMAILPLLAAVVAAASLATAASGAALVGDACAATSPTSCGDGMRCATCSPLPDSGPAVCSRTTPIDPKKHGTGLPFNKYSWLTTHNSFAVAGTTSATGSPIVAPPNQEDSVTSQLKNGVRGLMLDTYDFKNDVWLCHSFSGKCYEITAYRPALSVLKEIQGFLESNPSEVITIFVEDYAAPGSLGKVLAAAGLTKYMFPVAKMPKNGGDWPLLKDMIAQDQRLVVFTSKQGKEDSEGLAHEWNYVLETQYGSEGLGVGECPKRSESRPMDSRGQSLLLLNFFTTNPSQRWACMNNSAPLIAKLQFCYHASANRWPNFIAVDFYMRSSGGGAPLATDVANGRLQCGCDNIANCKPNTSSGACAISSLPSSPSSSSTLPPALAPSMAPSSWPYPSSSSPSSFFSLSSSLSLSPSSLYSALPPSMWWSSSSPTSALSIALPPSWSSYGSPSLSPSSPPSSAPALTPAMPPSTVSLTSLGDTTSAKEPPPKSTTDAGTTQEAPPKSSTDAAGMAEEAPPKSTSESDAGIAVEAGAPAMAPAPNSDADDTSGAAVTSRRISFLLGLPSLALIISQLV